MVEVSLGLRPGRQTVVLPDRCNTLHRFVFLIPQKTQLSRLSFRVSDYDIVVFDHHELSDCHRDAPWDDSLTEVVVEQPWFGADPVTGMSPNKLDLVSQEQEPKKNPQLPKGVVLGRHTPIVLEVNLVVPSTASTAMATKTQPVVRCIGTLLGADLANDLLSRPQRFLLIQRRHISATANELNHLRLDMFVTELWIHWPQLACGTTVDRGVAEVKVFANGEHLCTGGYRGFKAVDDRTAAVRMDINASRIDDVSLRITLAPFLSSSKRRAKCSNVAIQGMLVLKRWIKQHFKKIHLPINVRRRIFWHLVNDLMSDPLGPLQCTVLSQNQYYADGRQVGVTWH